MGSNASLARVDREIAEQVAPAFAAPIRTSEDSYICAVASLLE